MMNQVSSTTSLLSLINSSNSTITSSQRLNLSDSTPPNIPDPIRLSLSSSFRTLMFQLVDQTTKEKETGVFGALPKVALVVSQSHQISELDFESAQRILHGSMKQFPDLFFVFLTNNVNTFKDMVRFAITWTNQLDQLNWICCFFQATETSERYHYVEANSVRIPTFKNSLEETFGRIPKRIASPFCKSTDERRSWDDPMRRDDFEEYLTPGEETAYRVSSFYLLGSEELRVKFQGAGYGDFTVCMSRQHDMLSKECKSVQEIENAWFNISQPCSSYNAAESCPSVYFSLQVDTTYMKCAESDCRFPDDVRISIRPEGLRCERNDAIRFSAQTALLILSLASLLARRLT